MINWPTWKKSWALLDARERRNAWGVLFVIVVAALSSAAMVGSVFPFLAVLADPSKIHSEPILSWGFENGGFTDDYDFLVAIGITSLVVILSSNILQILRVWAVARFAFMRIYTLSHKLLASYLNQPYEFIIENHTGELSTQILSESQEAVVRFFRPAGEVVASLLTIISVVTVLLIIYPVVAIFAFSVIGGLYGITFRLSRSWVKRSGETRALSNRVRFRVANEALSGFKDIKLLGLETDYVDRYRRPARRMASAVVSVTVLGQVPQYIMQAVGFGGIILLCLILLEPSSFASGTAALGGILPMLGVFAFAGQRLLPELSKLYKGLTQLNAGAAAIDLVHRDLVEKKIYDKASETKITLGLKNSLIFEDLTYNYPSAQNKGLSDVSLEIGAGEKIGIVGSTGAGKSTFADVVLGLLLPSKGRLVADNVEITNDNVRNWRQAVGYVPQEIFLIDASVGENIALGLTNESIDTQRLRYAAKTARIDDFVTKELPQGYDTIVGERGVRLSGGQRQRIGIARALYNDADLIVFDEATSALDSVTEREVMAAIESLPGDKTIILIAHRLTTVRDCDRIAVLDNGFLVGFDCWNELSRKNTKFRELVGNLT